MQKQYDFYYEMKNFYDDSCIICGYDDGKTLVFLPSETNIKEFDTEENAYNYAFRKGYRE